MQQQITLGGFQLAAGQTLPSNETLDAATNREGLSWSLRDEARGGPVSAGNDTANTVQPGTRRPHLTIAVKGQVIQGFSL